MDPTSPPRFLVLDTASPIVSLALGEGEGVTLLAHRTLELRRSSEGLLRAIEEMLEETNVRLPELAGIVALRGPGSFTGLRIGLATVLGLHQALALPATTLNTTAVLAAAGIDTEDGTDDELTITAAVDALRGDWWTRSFRRTGSGGPPRPLGPGGLCGGTDLPALGPCRLVGFGVEQIADEIAHELDAHGIQRREPPPLAPRALGLLESLGPPASWDGSLLTRPIYFRAPAVRMPAASTPPPTA